MPRSWRSELGLTEVEAGRLALVVTELGTNLLRHARKGRLLIAARPGRIRTSRCCPSTRGPALPNVAAGHERRVSRRGSSPGTGLGAVKRLAERLRHPHRGAAWHGVRRARAQAGAARAGVAAAPAFEVGAVCVPMPGETVCGDAWGCAPATATGATRWSRTDSGTARRPPSRRGRDRRLRATSRCVSSRGIVEHGPPRRCRTTRGAAVCAGPARRSAEDTLRMHRRGQRGGASGLGRVRPLDGHPARHGRPADSTARGERAWRWPAHALVVVHSDGIDNALGYSTASCRCSGATRRWWRPSCCAIIARQRDDATVVVLRRRS